MFDYRFVVKFIKNYMQGKYTTDNMVQLLNKEVEPLNVRNIRLQDKIKEQRKVIEHLKAKIESNERPI